MAWCLVSQRVPSNPALCRGEQNPVYLASTHTNISNTSQHKGQGRPGNCSDIHVVQFMQHSNAIAGQHCYHRALISPSLYKTRTNNAPILPELWDRMKNPYYVQHPYVSFLNTYFLGKADLWATQLYWDHSLMLPCLSVCLLYQPLFSWLRLHRWLWGSEQFLFSPVCLSFCKD